MGFCTPEEYTEFLRSCPEFERMLVRSGIILLKYWFSVSDDEQERRFHDRAGNPARRWKLSELDIQGRDRWVERHLLTVGLVDWSLDRKGLTSGFVPEKVADDLDFVSVHLYPKKGQVDEALKTLAGFA